MPGLASCYLVGVGADVQGPGGQREGEEGPGRRHELLHRHASLLQTGTTHPPTSQQTKSRDSSMGTRGAQVSHKPALPRTCGRQAEGRTLSLLKEAGPREQSSEHDSSHRRADSWW